MGLLSRIRGRLRHSGTQADKLSEELLEAQARLARAELLPDSAFTIGNSFYNMRHGIDEKPKRIAELKAHIAYLETKIKGNDLVAMDLGVL
jgi:hypothetical protein